MLRPQADIDEILRVWTAMHDANSFGSMFPYPTIPTLLNLTISDKHKPLLLANTNYIPHCVDGLVAMLDVQFRPEVPPALRANIQRSCKCSS